MGSRSLQVVAAMPDHPSVGGLRPLGERYGRSSQPQDRGASTRKEPGAGPEAGDSVAVHHGAEVAFALLQKLVLAATWRRLCGREPDGDGREPGRDPFVHPSPRTPEQAVGAIHSDQRWLVAGQVCDAALLHAAFVDGLDQAEGILREVDQEDSRTHRWFDAVRAALG